jgi:hypothetical protein
MEDSIASQYRRRQGGEFRQSWMVGVVAWWAGSR